MAEEAQQEGRIPADRNPKWPGLAEPLLAFLGTPRNWDELEEWGRQQPWSGTLLRNCLAWLDTRGLAYSWWKEPRVAIWARTGWAEKAKKKAKKRAKAKKKR